MDAGDDVSVVLARANASRLPSRALIVRRLTMHLGNRWQNTADRALTRVETARVARVLAPRKVEQHNRLLAEGPPPHLTRLRLWFVHALIAFVVGGHLYDIVRNQEHWPFSPYPMFSVVDTRTTHETLRVFGIASDGEIPLLPLEYLYPLDQCRLSTALSRIRQRESASVDLHDAVHDIWTRYEVRRRSGGHDGPPLAGVRLYALKWRLDAHAHNAQQPDEREMLIEVRPQAGNSTQELPP
jgi:hypothetical protein